MKHCAKCGQIKQRTGFYRSRRRKDGLQSECKQCQLTRKETNRQWLKTYKATLVCEICGESCFICLDFHHIDTTQKDCTVAITAECSITRAKQEIDKCRVLCANCHRKLHAGIIL